MNQGDTEGARVHLGTAAKRNAEALRHLPDDPIVLGNAGYIAFLWGREQEAKALLERALLLGGERLRQGEVADSRKHEVPADEAFRTLLSSLRVGETTGARSRSRSRGSKLRRKKQ
jgi:hypothetical protein